MVKTFPVLKDGEIKESILQCEKCGMIFERIRDSYNHSETDCLDVRLTKIENQLKEGE